MGCHVEAKPKHLKNFTTRDSSPAKQVQNDIVSLRASIASVAIERAERSKTLDCFANARNDTKTKYRPRTPANASSVCNPQYVTIHHNITTKKCG